MEDFPAHLVIKKSCGHTMLELMVVMAVMTILTTMGFWGWRSYDRYAQLRNAQREIVSRLQLARNEALAGVLVGTAPNQKATHTATFSIGNSYSVDGIAYQLTNVRISGIAPAATRLCFFHPAETLPDATDCNDCEHFACDGVSEISGDITLTLEHQVTHSLKTIKIEGSDLQIRRIYEAD